jgi:hypothetical protein
MEVDQELIDAITDALNDSNAYRIERGEKPSGQAVQDWINQAEHKLDTETRRQFFAPSAIRYEADGDCLWK